MSCGCTPAAAARRSSAIDWVHRRLCSSTCLRGELLLFNWNGSVSPPPPTARAAAHAPSPGAHARGAGACRCSSTASRTCTSRPCARPTALLVRPRPQRRPHHSARPSRAARSSATSARRRGAPSRWAAASCRPADARGNRPVKPRAARARRHPRPGRRRTRRAPGGEAAIVVAAGPLVVEAHPARRRSSVLHAPLRPSRRSPSTRAPGCRARHARRPRARARRRRRPRRPSSTGPPEAAP